MAKTDTQQGQAPTREEWIKRAQELYWPAAPSINETATALAAAFDEGLQAGRKAAFVEAAGKAKDMGRYVKPGILNAAYEIAEGILALSTEQTQKP